MFMDEKEQNEFYKKIEACDVMGVIDMLVYTPELANARLSCDGRSPLIHSVMNAMTWAKTEKGKAQIGIINVLLKAGADPNARTGDGRNALGWAAGLSSETVEVDQYDCGRVVQVIMEPRTQDVFREIVALLLTAGTDSDAKACDRSDHQTKTMVEFARQDGRIRDEKLITYLHGNSPRAIMSGLIKEYNRSKTTLSNPLARDGAVQTAQAFSNRPAPPKIDLSRNRGPKVKC